jgi:hypothetical protein
LSRRRSEITPRQVDRDYPHQVEIAIPEGGQTRLNAIHGFCRGADFLTRGIGLKRLETGRDGVRFSSRYNNGGVAAAQPERLSPETNQPPPS